MVAFIAAPKLVVKRDGKVVSFDRSRILQAFINCFQSLGRIAYTPPNELVDQVINLLGSKYVDTTPTVEQVQDAAELVLQINGEFDAAKAFIIYRHEHEKKRKNEYIPDNIRQAFLNDDKFFPTPLQRFQFLDKYSRYNYAIGRRETWVETVNRTVSFLHELASPYADFGHDFYENIRRGILDMKVMPSMRMLAMAGAPARRDNVTIYNCSYLEVDSIESIVESMLISMAGCGVGYSVEQRCTLKLPEVKIQNNLHKSIVLVQDSAEGWAAALRRGLECWFDGDDVEFDYSFIRPAGSPLIVKGGRASGPEHLREMLDKIRKLILGRQGGRLSTLDAHDIMCHIGDAVVSGGVRRTALISLFDSNDQNMLECKSGDFESENDQRWNANNSLILDHNPYYNQRTFMDQFYTMIKSDRGEPGIVSRKAADALMPIRRDRNYYFGSNPCGEIILRPNQFCNLSQIIARKGDTIESLREKAILATQIGTLQSLATYFPNLRSKWRENCEEERLLGVDINGQSDAQDSLYPEIFTYLQGVVLKTNKELAQQLMINESAATTCVKPNGNSGVLLDASSGLHARWAPYYIRRVRLSANSPIAKVLTDSGMKLLPENNDDPINPTTVVASFPVKSPVGAVVRADLNAVAQCEWWLVNKLYWTEHNPSVTIYYGKDEVISLMYWVWNHLDKIGGMSFLPRDDAKYRQMPYEEITEDEYNELISKIPERIEWERIYIYDGDKDNTNVARELACVAGVCEKEV